MARRRAWTQDVTSPAAIAVVEECNREGIRIEVMETEAEWKEAFRFPKQSMMEQVFGWRMSGRRPVRWGKTVSAPIKRSRHLKEMIGLTWGAVAMVGTPFGFLARNSITVWSPRKLKELEEEVPEDRHVPWPRVVAHEMGHLYWARYFDLDGSTLKTDKEWKAMSLKLSEAAVRIGENRSLQREFIEEFGRERVEDALEHAMGYNMLYRGEELFVELMALCWWAKRDRGDVYDYWDAVKHFLDLRGLI